MEPVSSDDSVARGRKIFMARCSGCHTAVAGAPNRKGPNLNGIFGRKAGTVPGYEYSPANAASEVVWDAEALEAYLLSPQEFMPGTRKQGISLESLEDRRHLIAYLKNQSPS